MKKETKKPPMPLSAAQVEALRKLATFREGATYPELGLSHIGSLIRLRQYGFVEPTRQPRVRGEQNSRAIWHVTKEGQEFLAKRKG